MLFKKITDLNMNLETGSDQLLKFIGKTHTCKKARHVFATIHKLNPRVKLLTNIILGLPTENMGDVLDTAKIILETRPDFVRCNYFVCSPNSPLAKYPQLTESCMAYHLKTFINSLVKTPIEQPYNFKMICYRLYKNPHSRKVIKELEDLNYENNDRKILGFLPHHFKMLLSFNIKSS